MQSNHEVRLGLHTYQKNLAMISLRRSTPSKILLSMLKESVHFYMAMEDGKMLTLGSRPVFGV